MRELPARDVLAGVRQGAEYARGVWERLNGGGRSGGPAPRLPDGLPLPTATKVSRPSMDEHTCYYCRVDTRMHSLVD